MNGIFQNPHGVVIGTLSFVAAVLGGAVILGIVAHAILYAVIRSIGKYRNTLLHSALYRRTKRPTRWLFAFLAFGMTLPAVQSRLPEGLYSFLQDAVGPLVIIVVAWSLIRFTDVLEDIVLHHYEVETGDLRARRINTQFQVLKRILVVAIVVFALGSILMTFERIRNLGQAILASAGIIGIIVGVAAQRSVANLLAGIQIALTEPIRLGDSVVVEEEFGTIEEITLTYVVVKVWDNRRLVLPIGYFIEKPFQNWTREPSNILGTVFLYTDYTVPVEAIRAEFLRVAAESPLSDGAAAELSVTTLSKETVELRAVMSARTADDLWKLRCMVREHLIGFIQRNYPGSLPRFRAEISPADTGKAQSEHRP